MQNKYPRLNLFSSSRKGQEWRNTFFKELSSPKNYSFKRALAPIFYGITRLTAIVLLFSTTFLSAEDESKIFYPAQVQEKTSSPTSSTPFFTSVLYLAFLAGMGYVAYFLWRKKVVPQSTVNSVKAALEVTTTRPLGNRQFLVVVKYNNKELLLGVGQGFITKLESDVIANSPSNSSLVKGKKEDFESLIASAIPFQRNIESAQVKPIQEQSIEKNFGKRGV